MIDERGPNQGLSFSARMAQLVDAGDLNSPDLSGSCGFEPHSGHTKQRRVVMDNWTWLYNIWLDYNRMLERVFAGVDLADYDEQTRTMFKMGHRSFKLK